MSTVTSSSLSFEEWLNERPSVEEDPEEGLAPGTMLTGCRIQDFLGAGGFADVYRATDGEGNPVAVKILKRTDEDSRRRFAREVRILSEVKHPNILRLIDSGTYENRPYMVTELLRPLDLPCGDRAVARFLGKVVSAVEALHAHGYVHRDLKPSNILCRADGEPVLIDFGLAAPISVAEGRRVAVGTVGYSAPEQFSGQAAGREADVHALGALIGACFGGKMSRCWHKIYLTATNSNPKTRYPSVLQLHRAIGHRHWGQLAALAILALLLGLAAAGGLRYWHIEYGVPHHLPRVHDL